LPFFLTFAFGDFAFLPFAFVVLPSVGAIVKPSLYS